MKKAVTLLSILALFMLAACGSDNSGSNGGSKSGSGGPATHSTTGKVYNQKFGDPFTYHRQNTMTKATTKLKITLSDYEVVKERQTGGSANEDYDFVKVFAQVENIGDENSNDMAVRQGAFEVYDGNGKSVSVIAFYVHNEEDEFDPSELRPGGKNEGYIYIPITEGAVPAEMIYFDSTNKNAAFANQFVFKL